MRLLPSTATFGVAFALVNIGLLAYMGAPLPPQPWLSIVIITAINLLLFAYTPTIISLLNGRETSRSASYQPVSENNTAVEERVVIRTRVLIFAETYFTVFLRASFKDGQYTDEYHHPAFIMIMLFAGIWGGVVALIVWCSAASIAASSTASPSTTISPTNDTDVGAEHNGIDISLSKV